MNAVEIEQAISELAEQPFDPSEFPFAFLQGFGNKELTIKRLRKGETNKSDVGGVLQTNNIHIRVAPTGDVTRTLSALRASPATARYKAKFILATDGETFEAEDLTSGESVACDYPDFPDHFGFFLPLAGITTVQQIRESSFDIRATSRLSRLYLELLKENPEWDTEKRRRDMNHFMARLIFCFFAEDTEIFQRSSSRPLFTSTVEMMSERDASNTHEVIQKIFLALNVRQSDRRAAGVPRWADAFPYVNGGLFSGSLDVPRFSRIARSYLLHIGNLDWTKINPDIFGSMIQAVADDEERGELGMHYTSVPNILKVLNPLFLDDLRAKLAGAGDNPRKLLNLRKRLSRIRVFDPACGSGNFLVIAYKEMRRIEAEINKRRDEAGRRSDIPLTNFRGIELRDFPAEIARLALIIAEYQCDVLYRGQKLALAEFLPLENENWIVCGNALRMDWFSVCPPTGTGVKLVMNDLFDAPYNQTEIDFENAGGEVYACGNPPYKGSQDQTPQQKEDLRIAAEGFDVKVGSADYVLGWFLKGASYVRRTDGRLAFVSTNSVHQGRQVANVWPTILGNDLRITFAEPSFKWSNLASKKAAVMVSVVGIAKKGPAKCQLISGGMSREVNEIGPYLVANTSVIVADSKRPLSERPRMDFGSMPNDGGALLMSRQEAEHALERHHVPREFIHPVAGTKEFINGLQRYCIWIRAHDVERASQYPFLRDRFDSVEVKRRQSPRASTARLSSFPYRFGEVRQRGDEVVLIVAKTSSEARPYLPAALLPRGFIVTEAFGIYDAPLWAFAVIESKLHYVWMATVCGRMKRDYRYSNTLGWNTFPIPTLTDKNKADLTRCAEDILLAREAHFPATIADLYDAEAMPDDLREAHERNDEVLERIYIGRRFRNDTERLEKLFEFYTKLNASRGSTKREDTTGAIA